MTLTTDAYTMNWSNESVTYNPVSTTSNRTEELTIKFVVNCQEDWLHRCLLRAASQMIMWLIFLDASRKVIETNEERMKKLSWGEIFGMVFMSSVGPPDPVSYLQYSNCYFVILTLASHVLQLTHPEFVLFCDIMFWQWNTIKFQYGS